jgi:hypothetical protein
LSHQALAGFLQFLIRKHTTFVLATSCEPTRVTGGGE